MASEANMSVAPSARPHIIIDEARDSKTTIIAVAHVYSIVLPAWIKHSLTHPKAYRALHCSAPSSRHHEDRYLGQDARSVW